VKNAIVAARYAKALYDLASEQKIEEKVLNELRATAKGFEASREDFESLISPTVSVEDRRKIVTTVLGKNHSELFTSFVLLLVSKNRLGLFFDIVDAYQNQSDLLHGVTRGVVKSPSPLGPEDRSRLEETVSRVKKKAILEYKQSPELIGGLLARVGSYTFDDSLDTQLRLLYENLNRASGQA